MVKALLRLYICWCFRLHLYYFTGTPSKNVFSALSWKAHHTFWFWKHSQCFAQVCDVQTLGICDSLNLPLHDLVDTFNCRMKDMDSARHFTHWVAQLIYPSDQFIQNSSPYTPDFTNIPLCFWPFFNSAVAMVFPSLWLHFSIQILR